MIEIIMGFVYIGACLIGLAIVWPYEGQEKPKPKRKKPIDEQLD